MAKANKKPAADKNLPVAWDEELASQAEISNKAEEATATGQFFGLQGGILTFNGNPVPGNQMCAIILDFIMENVYYEGTYDPQSPKPPSCFAYSTQKEVLDKVPMVPHELVPEPFCEACEDCDNNKWGSAEKGKGKACRNTRRLALIIAGDVDPATSKITPYKKPELYEDAAITFMKIPVTSVRGFAGFVKSLAATVKRPPHGIYTRISVVQDAKTQFKVVFEPFAAIPDEHMGIVMGRHREAQKLISFPYQMDFEEEAPKKSTAKNKPVVKGKTKKY